MRRRRHQQSAQLPLDTARGASLFTPFDSPAAFADAIAAHTANGGGWSFDNKSWTGETLAESLALSRSGNDALVAESQSLIDSLRVTLPETVRAAYVPAPYGAYPIVPEFLIGHPFNMRAKRRIEDDRAPLRVYVDLATSGSVDVETIAKRGTAILALAMMLSESRALDLYVLSPLNNFGAAAAAIVKINTQPLELATACYAFTSAGFARNMGYGWARDSLGIPMQNTNWAFGIHPEGTERATYVSKMRAALDLQPADLFIPPVYAGEAIAETPALWLTERLAELGALAESETA